MPQLGVGRRQRRHQHDDVAERTKEDAAVAQRQTDVIAGSIARRERLPSTRDRRRARCRPSTRPAGCRRHAGATRAASALREARAPSARRRRMMSPSASNPSVASAAAQPERVAGVGVSVEEVAILVVAAEKRVVNLIGGERRGNRQIAAGQSLRDAQQIGRHPFALAREHRAGAAEAGRHLVEDQQRAMLAARGGRRATEIPRAASAFRLPPARRARGSPRRRVRRRARAPARARRRSRSSSRRASCRSDIDSSTATASSATEAGSA